MEEVTIIVQEKQLSGESFPGEFVRVVTTTAKHKSCNGRFCRASNIKRRLEGETARRWPRRRGVVYGEGQTFVVFPLRVGACVRIRVHAARNCPRSRRTITSFDGRAEPIFRPIDRISAIHPNALTRRNHQAGVRFNVFTRATPLPTKKIVIVSHSLRRQKF